VSRLVLASASPRRKALLAALGLDFNVIVSNTEETFEGKPESMVVVNARAKCDEVVSRLDSLAIVIAADTLVFLDDRVLGKPADTAEACAMLAALSGKTHEVITGLSLRDTASGKSAEGLESTRVTFRTLAPEEIERFVKAVNPVDRAGAYTVDGPGSLLVERYEGCYLNVLGLPVVKLDLLLRKMGLSLFDRMDIHRCTFL